MRLHPCAHFLSLLLACGPAAHSGIPEPSFAKTIEVDAKNLPSAVIDGPAIASLGDLVILSADRSDASDFVWRLTNSEKSFLEVDTGRRCVFASGTPGKFVFVLAVAKEGEVAVALHTVEIRSPEPLPPTPQPPGPEPTPDPEPPPGKFRLAKLARDWALATVSLVPAQRKETARSLAASFQSMAAAIAAGTLSRPDEILAKTLASNQEALGAERAAWKGWGEQLSKCLEAFHAAGRLRTAEEFATAWREIAVGLEGVSNAP